MSRTIEQVVKNPDLQPLTMDQLRRQVPAVFATHADESVSERYGFASTAAILQAFEKEGYVPVEARTYMRRDATSLQYSKHMLRLRRAGDVRKLVVGEVVPQAVIINSHDRSSMLHMFAGMHRLVCANGLLVSSKEFCAPLRVRHTSGIVEEAMANLHRIAGDVGKVTGIIERMQRVHLTVKQQTAFASGALALRCPEAGKRAKVDPALVLAVRRKEDEGDSVWQVYNRVQENIIQGGIARTSPTGRTTTSKPINSLERDISVNSGLWEMAMAAIAKAAKR
jgi:hypothetical protein